MLRLETPGGGGYGFKKSDALKYELLEVKNLQKFAKGSLYSYDQIQSSA